MRLPPGSSCACSARSSRPRPGSSRRSRPSKGCSVRRRHGGRKRRSSPSWPAPSECWSVASPSSATWRRLSPGRMRRRGDCTSAARRSSAPRSEEHTSELQSHHDLVCRLLLEKKKKKKNKNKYIKKKKKKKKKNIQIKIK